MSPGDLHTEIAAIFGVLKLKCGAHEWPCCQPRFDFTIGFKKRAVCAHVVTSVIVIQFNLSLKFIVES